MYRKTFFNNFIIHYYYLFYTAREPHYEGEGSFVEMYWDDIWLMFLSFFFSCFFAFLRAALRSSGEGDQEEKHSSEKMKQTRAKQNEDWVERKLTKKSHSEDRGREVEEI